MASSVPPLFPVELAGVVSRYRASERRGRGCPGVFPLELPAGTAFTDLPHTAACERSNPCHRRASPCNPCSPSFSRFSCSCHFSLPPSPRPFAVRSWFFRIIFRVRSVRRRVSNRENRQFFVFVVSDFFVTVLHMDGKCFNYSSNRRFLLTDEGWKWAGLFRGSISVDGRITRITRIETD